MFGRYSAADRKRKARRRTSSRRVALESLERRLALDASAAIHLVADVATTPEDQAVDISVLENDGGPQLEVTAVNNVENGTAVINDSGGITFTPDADFNGEASFEYTAKNKFGVEASAEVTVDVTPVNDAPLAGHNRAVLEGGAATVDVLANDTDVDGDDLTVTQIAGTDVAAGESVTVDGGTVVLNEDGSLTFTASDGFTGRTAFQYTVADQDGATATATVVVTSPDFVNTAPTAVNDALAEAIPEDGEPVTIEVLDNDSDPDGDPLTVTMIDGVEVSVGEEIEVQGGVAVLNADGTITFTPAADFNGDAEFTYTISDGAAEATATVTVPIEAVNDPPNAAPNEASVEAGAEVTIDVLGNDSDPDGDTLTVTQINGEDVAGDAPVSVEGGTVVVNADGTITFTADPDFSGEASFTYTVSDGDAQATATVTVDVTGAETDSPFHNPDLPTDVNADGRTDVADLRMVVMALRELGFGEIPEDADPAEVGLVDVNNDGLLSVADLVAVARSIGNGHRDGGPGNSQNAPGRGRQDRGPSNDSEPSDAEDVLLDTPSDDDDDDVLLDSNAGSVQPSGDDRGPSNSSDRGGGNGRGNGNGRGRGRR